MNLLEFGNRFDSEEKCKAIVKAFRDEQGVKCKNCGHDKHYWKSDKEVYQCKKCSFRTSLRSGTVMESSKLPFRYWLMAIHLLTSTKKSFSALEMQRQLGHKFYEPVFEMMHKLRAVMGKRDARYELKEMIEMDEGFFSSIDKENPGKQGKKKKKNNKRGRGSEKKGKVLVMIESEPVAKQDQKKHKPKSKAGYLKMVVVEDLSATTINYEVEGKISPQATVKTDGYRGYSRLKEKIGRHIPINMAGIKEVHKTFPWVHTAIGNARRILDGIHHMNEIVYLQNYLNEFCYKFNRRYFKEKLFDRLMIASLTDTWY